MKRYVYDKYIFTKEKLLKIYTEDPNWIINSDFCIKTIVKM